MNVLVTGAAGFIGSWVSQALLRRGERVVGLDSFDPFYDRAIKERNLAALRARGAARALTFIEGDILERALLDRLLAEHRVDRVVHLAALAGVRPSIAAPARYVRVNVEGTVQVLEACRAREISQIVVASSSSVYGARSETPFRESDPCDRPASPYAASKKATELVCASYSELHGLAVTCLRYFTVYGPRQRPEMAIHKFVRMALDGEAIPVFGDGSSGRDYTYIDDIVDGTLAALDRQQPGAFEVYNLGGTQPVLLRELVTAIAAATGVEVRTDPQPWQAGDVPITCADVGRAAADLGYAPRIALAEGLRRFVAWYRDPARGAD